MIHFVGAGCGAADLITVRGKNLLEQADVIIYAGSLVNPALLDYKKPGCRVYDSAKMTLEEVLSVMFDAEAADFDTVVAGALDWSETVQQAELRGKTVLHAFPDSPMAAEYRVLAESVLAIARKGASPC